MVQILERIREGAGKPDDIELLRDITKMIDGRSFCGLGDAAAWPVAAALRVFPEEFEYYIQHGRSIVQSPEGLAMMPESDLARV
jgi:NADH-quinone oxidoreductase subunit F